MAKNKKNISRKVQQSTNVPYKFEGERGYTTTRGVDTFGDPVSMRDEAPGCKQDVSCIKGYAWVGEPHCGCRPIGIDLDRPPIDPVDNINISFGRPEDYIELHIHDNNGNLLYSEEDFNEYKTEEATAEGFITAINIEPEEILANRGYSVGTYVLKLNVLRRKILNSPTQEFIIKEISPSRKELKVITPSITNQILDPAVSIYISELESSIYYRQFELNFGSDNLIPGINLLLDKSPKKHELLLKLLNPLPGTYKISDRFILAETLTDPISVSVTLNKEQVIFGGQELRGPNFSIDVKLDNSIPSNFETYNSILKYNATSSYQDLLNKLEHKEIPSIQYDYIRPISGSEEDELDTPYHFENFVHFGSATERLKNFRYKLELIELYNSQSNNLTNIPGATSASAYILTDKENILSNKRDIIKNFDGYERFLYYTSGTYAWPKSNSSKPYNLFPVSSSEAKTWFGDEKDTFSLHGGQILSASLYDKQNSYNLEKLIPNHIVDNPDNNFYITFTHMVGQHFDHIWTYIKHITEVNNTHHTRGISKDLVYFQLKSLGLETYDQFENSDLIEYILGEGSGSNQYNPSNFYSSSLTPSETMVTASNDGSIPKGDITKEIWKRLYHNAPYLLKTKGTERGVKALMSCYGIPSTILNVKEYGGPTKNLNLDTTYKTFSYEKSGLALFGDSGTNGYFIKTNWSSSLTDALSSSAKTVQFRIKPVRTNANQHLFSLLGSEPTNDPILVLKPYIGSDISSSGDSKQYGRLDLYLNGAITSSTSYFPVYNGDFWNVHIGTLGTSGSDADLEFGAYQSNFLKNTFKYKASIGLNEVTRSLSFGDPYYGGKNKGGALEAYFGGVSANVSPAYNLVDGLYYSGSLQEIKYHFGELLSDATLTKHSLEPFMYGGNEITSSYENVVLRLPLGSNDQQNSSSFHPNYKKDYIPTATILSNMTSQKWEEVIETHHHISPDTVGISLTSEKVRTDSGSIDDNILSPKIKSETSTLDDQPQDYEDLGIFFSPTTELNEDIVYTLGGFRLDDYIGSPLPSAQTSSIYEDLDTINNYYFRKTKDRYNYTDYIKQIQYIDHTLFKLIEQWVPAKSNLKTGLLIEPHYLERTKFARELPTRHDLQTMTTGSHQTFDVHIKGETIDEIYTFQNSSVVTTNNYAIHGNRSGSDGRRIVPGTNANINVYGYILDEPQCAAQAPIKPYVSPKPFNYIKRESSTLLGNATKGKKSNRYFRTPNSGSQPANYIIY